MNFGAKKFFLFAFSIFFTFSIQAQKPQAAQTPPPKEEDECCISRSEVVKLDVSVWSSKNGYLKNLTADNFEIFQGKDKQEIEYFSQKDEPVSVGIIFDTSESMNSETGRSRLNEIPFAVEGLISFINKSNPDNEYFVLEFSRKVSVLLEPTQDKNLLATTLKKVISTKPEGTTSVYNAINLGYEKISKTKFEKKIILLISDGIDNNSKKNDFGNIKEQSRQNRNTIFYSVNIITNSRDDFYSLSAAEDKLINLTENSGGRIFYPRNREQVIQSFEMLADELRSQYTIGFVPKEVKGIDLWRKVKVDSILSKEEKEGLGKVFTRAQKGFYR